PHRRKRLLLLPHGQTGPLPLAQPDQRLAAGPHPLFHFGLGLCAAPHHTDVLRGRPDDPRLSHRALHPERRSGAQPDRPARPRRLRRARQPGLPLRPRGARQPRYLVRKHHPRSEIMFRELNKPFYLKETASQTAGPYVHIGLAPKQAGFDIFENNFGNVLVTPETEGERARREGRVVDGSGALIRDALLETWQANAAGRYNHPADKQEDKPIDPSFRGWGRGASDFETGVYSFDTIKPGAVVGRHGKLMAPHINVWIVARGINIGLHTRVYFSDEQE